MHVKAVVGGLTHRCRVGPHEVRVEGALVGVVAAQIPLPAGRTAAVAGLALASAAMLFRTDTGSGTAHEDFKAGKRRCVVPPTASSHANAAACSARLVYGNCHLPPCRIRRRCARSWGSGPPGSGAHHRG